MIDMARRTINNHLAFYRFQNCSEYSVNIYWSTPSTLIYYRCLAPTEFLDVNSYESHIWVFVNGQNGNRLWADGCYKFCCNSWKVELNYAKKAGLIEESHQDPFRKLVKITYPMLDLTYLAMETIRDSNISLEVVDTLEIPVTLRSDLKKMILIKCCMQSHEKRCKCLRELFRACNYLC